MTARNVLFAVLGAVALVLKRHYSGPLQGLVQPFGGNVVVSFALYYACLNAARDRRRATTLAAMATLAATTAFELTDGFGVTANVFDRLDLVANAVGVGLAVVADRLSRPLFDAVRPQDS